MANLILNGTTYAVPSDGIIDSTYNGYDISGFSGSPPSPIVIDQGVTLTTGYQGINWLISPTTVVEDDGYVTLSNGTVLEHSGTTTTAEVIANASGTIELAGVSAPVFGALAFGTPGGVISLDYGDNPSIFNDVANVSIGDTFEYIGVSSTSFTFVNGVVTLYSGTQPINSSSFEPYLIGSDATGFSLQVIDGNSYLTAICFLPGTQIRTASGEVAVEDIRIGDQVVAYRHETGENELRDVTWIGKQSARVRAGVPVDQAGYPVRVLKDAIAEGMPARDLLVTAEHCLFFDGKFIPARMLVNGRTIFFDQSFTNYDFYHVETENHAVIYAENMRTESYLDTGNRRGFSQPGQVVRFPAAAKTWADDAGAPLATDSVTVKPIWDAIADRAGAIAPANDAVATVETTNDPDVRIVAGGRTIRPTSIDGARLCFVLPRNADRIVVQSRSVRPAERQPWLDDRRDLGVAVAGIRLRTGSEWKDIAVDHPSLGEGWWDVEQSGAQAWRWTDGDAELSLGSRTGMTVLELVLHATAEYPVVAEQAAVEPLRAVAGAA
jgi:hypothetical protein